MTEDIWSIPSVTWEIAAVWLSTAPTTAFTFIVTFSEMELVLSSDSVTFATTCPPSATAVIEPSISSLVALAASSDLEARLRTTLSQISLSAETVAGSAVQVSNGAQSLSQGASEQASAIQELSATADSIAENARQTAVTAEEAGHFVVQAGAQLGVSVNYVHELTLAASSDLEARLRTSSATTAKPFPALPARAASTAAFKARILVWNAIFSMVSMILLISVEEPEIFSIAAFNSWT